MERTVGSRLSGYQVIGPKLPLRLKEIWAVRIRLQMANIVRDLTLFDLGLDSKLRGCDLVKLRIGDVAIGRSIRSRCMVVQQKTGRPVQFEITDACKESLIAWLEMRGDRNHDWIFPSRSNRGEHLTTRQYGRLVDEWVAMIGLNPSNYGTHSMRRNKVALIYKKTGNLRACQLLLGHSKLESTVRYLGVDIEDAISLSEDIEI
jgi:site-specific recombinase XerC